MTTEQLGEYSEGYRSQIKEIRHYANGVVSNNRPLSETGMIADRSLISIACDNGISLGFYGPRTLAIGIHVEVFEYKLFSGWKCDYRIIDDTDLECFHDTVME